LKRPLAAKVQIGRFLRMIFPAVLILLLGVGIVLGILVYKISHPDRVQEAVNPSHYLLPSLNITIPTRDRIEMPGWWIPGLKGAPGVILAPGYGMSRSDALSLAAVLHDHGFNLLVFGQRGSWGIPKAASTLGLFESGDMLEAVNFVKSRPESNREKIGIWGVDVGALSALRAAVACTEVRAIVADGAFESEADFLAYRIAEDMGLENRLVQLGGYQVFRLVHLFSGGFRHQPVRLRAISDRMILFIKGENRGGLADLTTAIYDKIQPQKEIISFKTSRVHLMSGEDLRSYDRQVANFFHLNLQ
jgi:hypothetical protein